MQLTVHLALTRRRASRQAPERRGSHAAPVPPPPVRRRIPPAPQDRALYTCGCGFAWTAAVTTAVGCPHCGVVQAW